MQVAKWGNSLAVRIPAKVADALGLKEGDDVVVRIAEDNAFEIKRDDSRERALERIRRFRRKLPPDWKFDRDEANAR
ncbi:antitoxin MazE [Rhizobium sp. BK275]|jgi:antitoxin MazE|uniref:AbrB/MazE/SpoVT family DNA-binding domain-containing protein n=1 Tax=unclassified Rhizobium TaxID=2613769 RepID=UPI00160927B0|nr:MULTISPECIES: AbrB/MazE/SpoVT family DNA-binding domain-containing protein [unclassified Rhizobium]MBB3389260.1 antitoxin MazE [Rhizobium sp. BK275]MBB3408629.1 antitoxin MazE [Rhizobium sp. BK316]